jgi:hypothetical protein
MSLDDLQKKLIISQEHFLKVHSEQVEPRTISELYDILEGVIDLLEDIQANQMNAKEDQKQRQNQ